MQINWATNDHLMLMPPVRQRTHVSAKSHYHIMVIGFGFGQVHTEIEAVGRKQTNASRIACQSEKLRYMAVPANRSHTLTHTQTIYVHRILYIAHPQISLRAAHVAFICHHIQAHRRQTATKSRAHPTKYMRYDIRANVPTTAIGPVTSFAQPRGTTTSSSYP